MDEKKATEFVVIPIEKVSEEALHGLINEFILREGTDYGQKEYSLEEKHSQIKKQLQAGKTIIVFDPAEESASLIRKEQLTSLAISDQS